MTGRPPVMSFTDEQLERITSAASAIKLPLRHHFLRHVADQLRIELSSQQSVVPSDAQVVKAIDAALRQIVRVA